MFVTRPSRSSVESTAQAVENARWPRRRHPDRRPARGSSDAAAPFHYIANGDGTEEMYDTEADPWEKDDLASSGRYPLDLERLRALLEDFRPLSQPPVVARDD
jgi:hypothetical protein